MRSARTIAITIGLWFLFIIYSSIFPGAFEIGAPIPGKPVILYGGPFEPSNFSNVVTFAAAHGFNTLMVLDYINHKQVLNDSELQVFSSYGSSRDIRFVPSFYIMSVNDKFDARELRYRPLKGQRIWPRNSLPMFFGDKHNGRRVPSSHARS